MVGLLLYSLNIHHAKISSLVVILRFKSLAFVLKLAYPCLVTTAYHLTKLRNGSVEELAEFAP